MLKSQKLTAFFSLPFVLQPWLENSSAFLQVRSPEPQLCSALPPLVRKLCYGCNSDMTQVSAISLPPVYDLDKTYKNNWCVVTIPKGVSVTSDTRFLEINFAVSTLPTIIVAIVISIAIIIPCFQHIHCCFSSTHFCASARLQF